MVVLLGSVVGGLRGGMTVGRSDCAVLVRLVVGGLGVVNRLCVMSVNGSGVVAMCVNARRVNVAA